MFAAVEKAKLHPSLQAYIEGEFVKTFRLTNRKFTFCVNGVRHRVGGIHRKLQARFYPIFNRGKRSRGVQKKSSSRKLGNGCDAGVFKYIATGKKPRQAMARALIVHIEETLKHTLQVAQLPVRIPELFCASQIDLMTMDADGELHLWEVKTGYPKKWKKDNGFIRRMPKVRNCSANHWELQRHYYALGLMRDVELKMKNTHVVNVFKECKQKQTSYCVQARKKPTWTKELDLRLH